MLVFAERGKPEYPEKNLSEQRREPTTNSTHIWRRVRESNPGHIGGRGVLSPLRHPCSPMQQFALSIRQETSRLSLLFKRSCNCFQLTKQLTKWKRGWAVNGLDLQIRVPEFKSRPYSCQLGFLTLLSLIWIICFRHLPGPTSIIAIQILPRANNGTSESEIILKD